MGFDIVDFLYARPVKNKKLSSLVWNQSIIYINLYYILIKSDTPLIKYTILFADIAGSTALYESLGDTQAESIVSLVLQSLSKIVNANNGEVIKTIGDEVMCKFTSSVQAIQAANEMHEFTTKQTFTGLQNKVAIRVGAHIGTILHGEGDIYGDTVNVCARIAALARPGKIMISEETYKDLSGPLKQDCRYMMQAQLKGKELPVRLYDVVWEQDDELTRITNTPVTQDTEKKLTLKYQDQEVELKQGALTIGRGRECNLIVMAPQASRCHCEVRLNGNKFALTDGSTNGTFILQNNVELQFHQETAPLSLSGMISLGQSVKSDNEHVIFFSISSGKT